MRQEVVHRLVRRAPALGDDRLEEAEQPDRRDHADDGGGAAQGPQHHHLEEQAHGAGRQHRHEQRRDELQRLPLAVELEEGEVGRERADGALREVDQP